MFVKESTDALWVGALTAFTAAGLAFGLYVWTAAPGLTWAHFGADGGDLLAAAVANGVPHPTGYPLYTLLLQGWLALGGLLYTGVEPARLGNLFSALCAAFSVGWTVLAAAALIGDRPWRWWIALAAGLLWAASPLLWSQALITEVYALHALLTAALGWALLARARTRGWLALLAALGIANHLTFVLLLPAAYWVWTQPSVGSSLRRRLALLCGSVALAALLSARILLAASAEPTPPVNWGYADNLSGLWWLVSGAAYRHYLFGVPPSEILARISAWAYTISAQFTPLGLAAALLGLARLDRTRPALRTLGLLWLLPVSVYAVTYNTTDSVVYLLPVVWMCALWIAVGLCVVIEWLEARGALWSATPVLAAAVIGALVLVIWRTPELSLRDEGTARQFLTEATAVLEPDSIVVSSADAETFALWYGAWASGELLQQAPGAVLVNYALYQFPWYHRLLGKLYPDVPGIAESFEALITANRTRRPIYLTEPLPDFAETELEPAGPLWKVVVSQP